MHNTLRKKLVIIGISLTVSLSLLADHAYALYSPRLTQQVGIIKQHVTNSQAQNGTESILEEIEQIKAYDKARRQAFETTGISAEVRIAQDMIFETTMLEVIQDPFNAIWMIFNFNGRRGEFISQCLRDEIWSLETLRDTVGAEMVKAYMLRDTFHGALLKEDYEYIVEQLELLYRYGNDPGALIDVTDLEGNRSKITSTEYFFGNKGTDPNYYKNTYGFLSNETGCPEGEFQQAFQQVVNSAKTLGTLGSAQGVEWGNIWAIAKANARIRAREWIRANQISLTIGGEEGGRAQSLVKGGGWDRFVGSVKTQLIAARNLVGTFTPFFHSDIYEPTPSTGSPTEAKTGLGADCRFYHHEDEVFRDCSENEIEQYEKCEDDEQAAKTEGIRCDRFTNANEFITIANEVKQYEARKVDNQQALREVETAFVYQVSLDSVAEQNIYLVDEALWDMNMHIKRGYEGVDKKAGEGIPTLSKELTALSNNQCPNK